MRHSFNITGYSYRLRPIATGDAAFIIEVRLEDEKRNKFINAIPNDVAVQERWLSNYFEREGDYYFVVENVLTEEPEGLVSIYDECDGKAEWGRWVIKKSSLASAESALLVFRTAFEMLGLEELYSRTIEDNKTVVSFHDSLREARRGVLENFFEIDGRRYNAVEHYVTKERFYDVIHPRLDKLSRSIHALNIKKLKGQV